MFRIYKGDDVIEEGESPLSITGLKSNTEITKGEYQVARLEDDRESEKIDIPAFKTLPIDVTDVSLSPKTSTADAGASGSRQLNVAVEPEEADNKSVSFSIEEADGLTVSDNGKIEWTEDTQPGEYTTTVTTDDGGFNDTHRLTLEEPEGGEDD